MWITISIFDCLEDWAPSKEDETRQKRHACRGSVNDPREGVGWGKNDHFCTSKAHSFVPFLAYLSRSVLEFFFGSDVCFCKVWFFSGSVYSVLAVALERYFTICQPFHYNLVLSHLGLGRISGNAWLFGRISSYPTIKSRISGNIRKGIPDNPAGYPASGKKKQIRPNPSPTFMAFQRFYANMCWARHL